MEFALKRLISVIFQSRSQPLQHSLQILKVGQAVSITILLSAYFEEYRFLTSQKVAKAMPMEAKKSKLSP
jgi:hypothetical protein